MARRQRLSAEDVERRGLDLAALQRRQQVALDEVGAAADIDHHRAVGQGIKQCNVQDVLKYRRKRQHVNQNVAAPSDRGQAVHAVEVRQAGYRLGRPAPAGDVEAKLGERHTCCPA